jgi:hypothetical protein
VWPLGSASDGASDRVSPSLVPSAHVLWPEVLLGRDLGVGDLSIGIAPLGQEVPRLEHVVCPLQANALCGVSVDFAAHVFFASEAGFRLCGAPIRLRRFGEAGLDGRGEVRLGLARRRVRRVAPRYGQCSEETWRHLWCSLWVWRSCCGRRLRCWCFWWHWRLLEPARLHVRPWREHVLCPLGSLRLRLLLRRPRRLLGPWLWQLLRLRLHEWLLLWLGQLLLWLDLLVGHGGGTIVSRVSRGGGSAAPWVMLLPWVPRRQAGVCAHGGLA